MRKFVCVAVCVDVCIKRNLDVQLVSVGGYGGGTTGIQSGCTPRKRREMGEIVSFGEWIQQRRNRLGLTRAGLARQVGCSTITIKKIERDEHRPSIQIAELLAQQLKIPAAEQDAFIRRARGEFVERFGTPTEISLADEPIDEDSSQKHNLPPQVTPFFGRSTEIQTIRDQLADPTCRLLTITGVGGMGKTRLAIEVASTLIGTFSDGIVYVPLAPVQITETPSRLTPPLAALTDALAISLQGQTPPVSQLQTYLRSKEMLILFDNFEHLLGAADSLTPLLAHAPDIKILVTSRERLNLQEEWLFPLQGLGYGQGKTAVDSQSAVDLFVQRARQIQHSFNPEADAEAVQRICMLVEGMPLGVELAASWVAQLTLSEIAAEIERELDFLETTMRNIPARHRSLRAVFAHSWQRLTETEQLVLMKVSVFRGGFDREAATAVAGATLRTLSALVNKSLLRRNQTGRYEIHELLRQFAAEKSKGVEDFAATLNRQHGRYYLQLLVSHLKYVKGEHAGDPALAQLPALFENLDNVRAAWQWGAAHQQFKLLHRATLIYYNLYDIRGWTIEAVDVAQQTIRAVQPFCNADSSSISAEERELACQVVAYQMGMLSWFQTRAGMDKQAQETAETALALVRGRSEEAQWTRWMCLVAIGYTLSYQGKVSEAVATGKELVTLAETMSDFAHMHALEIHTAFLFVAGDYDAAQQAAAASYRLVDSVNTLRPRIGALGGKGNIAVALGDYQQAAEYFRLGIDAAKKMSEQVQCSSLLTGLGNTTRLLGDYDAAASYLEESLALSTEMNVVSLAANALWGLGNLSADRGEYDVAKHYFRRSEQATPLPSRPTGGRGWVDLALGEVAEAKSFFLNQLQNSSQFRQPPLALDALAGLAHVVASSGELTRALELIGLLLAHPAALHESKERVHELQAELEAELSPELVAVALERGRALDLWRTAVSLLADKEQP